MNVSCFYMHYLEVRVIFVILIVGKLFMSGEYPADLANFLLG